MLSINRTNLNLNFTIRKMLSVFAAVLFAGSLTACGSSSDAVFTVPEETMPLAVGSLSPASGTPGLLKNKVDADGNPVLDDDGNPLVDIDSDTLVNYYAGSYGNPRQARRHFLSFRGGDNATRSAGGAQTRYAIIVGRVGRPHLSFATYQLISGTIAVIAGEGATNTFGGLLRDGDSTVISLQTSHAAGASLTIHIGDDAWTFAQGDSAHTITAAAGYGFSAYAREVTAFIDGENIARTNHFIAATYSALQFSYDAHNASTFNSALHGHANHIGLVTHPDNLPAGGVLSYHLGHAIGVYETGLATKDSSVLFGSGQLNADFTDNEVNLNLEMKTMLGYDFATIDVQNLYLSPTHNKFYDHDTTTAAFDFGDSTQLTDITYSDANDNLDQISLQGYFHGPNAEEVGGGLCVPYCNAAGPGSDNDTDTIDFLSITFIGHQQ